MKNRLEITNDVLQKVEWCPICASKLRQRRSHKIICDTCGFQIVIEKKYDYWLSWALLAVMFAFAIGFAVATYLTTYKLVPIHPKDFAQFLLGRVCLGIGLK